MLAQLEEDLLHLEGREHRLDQDGGADRAARDVEGALGGDEDVVPQRASRWLSSFGQVEVRTAAARRASSCALWKNQSPKSKMLALTGPPSTSTCPRPDASPAGGCRASRSGRERVGLLIGLEGERAPHRPRHRPWPVDDVRPGGGEGVLEVGHEDRCAGVERVDHHLRLGRAGDLDATVVEVGRCRGNAPFGSTTLDRVRQEVGHLAAVDASLARRAIREQASAFGIEMAMQLLDERDGAGGEDVVEMRDVGAGDDGGHRLTIACRRQAGAAARPAPVSGVPHV